MKNNGNEYNNNGIKTSQINIITVNNIIQSEKNNKTNIYSNKNVTTLKKESKDNISNQNDKIGEEKD